MVVKITVNLKLNPTEEQARVLFETLGACNNLCNDLSRFAFETKTFGQFSLHEAKYHETRGTSPLSSQMVVRCFAKVKIVEQEPMRRVFRSDIPNSLFRTQIP